MEPSTPQPGSSPASPPPRAFARGTGLVLQLFGVAVFLGNCLLCTFSGQWDHVMSRGEVAAAEQQGQPLGLSLPDLRHHPARAGEMATVVFGLVGAMGMIVFGFGLQQERPRSGIGAAITTTLLSLILIVAGIGLWSGQANWFIRLWHHAFTLCVFALTAFSFAAMRQMHRDPPPPDEPIPPDFDERAYFRKQMYGRED